MGASRMGTVESVSHLMSQSEEDQMREALASLRENKSTLIRELSANTSESSRVTVGNVSLQHDATV